MSLIPDSPHTFDQFLDLRAELPEGGQWSELDAGEITIFEAPDSDHGLVVSHLSQKLTPLAMSGTPLFRPGLRLATGPDTVRYPAVAYFDAPARFDLLDADAVDEPPAWVIEIASTGDRRRAVTDRVQAYQAWGVHLLWVIDPRAQELTVLHAGQHSQHGPHATVTADPVANVSFPLADLFVEPEWWGGKPQG